MSKKPEARKRASPVKYSDEVAHAICEQLAKGVPLKRICDQEGMPSYSCVKAWEIDREDFKALSMRAREIGCHAIADELIDIADDGRNDWMLTAGEDGGTGYRLNGEHIQRSRLRIETRMRLLGKWLPKVYGDKMALTDGDGKPLQAAAPVFHVTVKGG